MEAITQVSLSGQLALERRMATIAQNIANANTTGYRAAGVNFGTIVAKTGEYPTSFAAMGVDNVIDTAGGLEKTENPLDVAIQGKGYFAMQAGGQTVYSRDGRMHVNNEGTLLSSMNYPILDAGGSTITIDPSQGPVTINREGSIFQNGIAVGKLGLFELDLTAGFSRYDNSALIPRRPAQPLADSPDSGVAQYFVEGSNVNSISEMVRLIQVSRAFETLGGLNERSNDAEISAIKTLGSGR